MINGRLHEQAGTIRKMKHEQTGSGNDELSVRLRSIVVVAVLMLFVVCCTLVTSNTFSSFSIDQLWQ